MSQKGPQQGPARCRTEHLLLFIGLVVLFFPYLFWNSNPKPDSALLPLPRIYKPTNSSFGLSSSSLADLSWKTLTWRPVVDSACVRTYLWTKNVAELQCEANATANGLPTCGGVVMSGCSSYAYGEFVRSAVTDIKPQRLYLPLNSVTSPPLCTNATLAQEGKYLEPTTSFHQDNVWVPKSCSLVPLDLDSLARACSKGPLVYLGDSHGRNYFSAFVSGIRQKYYFLETHDDEFKEQQGVLVYRVERVNGKLRDHRGVVLLAQNGSNLHDEADCAAEADLCLQVLFFWAGKYDQQQSHFSLLQSLHPSIVVFSPGNSYEGGSFSQSYLDNLAGLVRTLPQTTFSFISWPYGHRLHSVRETAINTWKRDVAPDRIHFVGHFPFASYGGVQGPKEWHYACAGRHNSAGLLIGATAHENCTDVVDTVLARIVLTLATH